MRLLPLLVLGCAPAPEFEPLDLQVELLPSTLPLPAPAGLHLDAGNFVAGDWVTLQLSGASPGEEIRLLFSRSGLGDGPCHAILGGSCVGILGPVQRMTFSAVAGADGSAAMRILVPAAAGGRYLSVQGYVVGTGELTNPVGRPVAPPGTPVGPDIDGDGSSVDDGDCADFDPSYGPEASDATFDTRDQNCDDADGDDGDGDGSIDPLSGGDDCDDNDPDAYPGATEVCDEDGADEDCDGVPDDGCFDGLDCQDILEQHPGSASGTYQIDPDGVGGEVPYSAWCEMSAKDGGWTKVAYFTTPRPSNTAAVTPGDLAGTLAGVGKLSDAQINTLMDHDHEMLALRTSNTSQWMYLTWGQGWTWDETRVASSLGGFCQDFDDGGWLERWDGTRAFADYRDPSVLGHRSSYCWHFDWMSGGEGGIDLQDDEFGRTHAATTSVAQSPFAMFVRRGDPTCDTHADCPIRTPICDAGVCAPAQDCKELHDTVPALPDGMYGIDPLATGSPVPAWCEMDIDGGGWTKVLYAANTRTLTTGDWRSTVAAESFTAEGKMPDATINALMSTDHKMLAVYPANPARWLVATWGTTWTFQDNRQSGQPGGFCQTVPGGGNLRLWDGSTRTANYTDGANLRSSYCYNVETGFDLQNDGSGQSNGALPGISQQPFVMMVRR